MSLPQKKHKESISHSALIASSIKDNNLVFTTLRTSEPGAETIDFCNELVTESAIVPISYIDIENKTIHCSNPSFATLLLNLTGDLSNILYSIKDMRFHWSENADSNQLPELCYPIGKLTDNLFFHKAMANWNRAEITNDMIDHAADILERVMDFQSFVIKNISMDKESFVNRFHR
ncbi:hypothetical protein LMH73_008775 [Vibrio splendidus]|nr:hypothetical protein [Vibrio splendidus]MCC4879439.1 hypothetical protein [Vibrio splendidus]